MKTLQELVDSSGYQLSSSKKSRYIQGLLQLVGGLPAMDFLRDGYMIRMLSNAQLRKGKAFTYKQLQQLAKPEQSVDYFYEQMKVLIAKGLFLRGYQLQCPVCDLDAWYGLGQVNEQVVCQGCHFEFQMSLTCAFAYRPNRLLVEALKSGAMTILLTALWLSEQDDRMEWQTDSLIQQGEHQTDIDLLVRINSDIWLVECKDNFKTGDTAEHELIVQLETGIQIARDINADYHALATLYEGTLSESLTDFLASHQIKLLTRRELLRV